MTDEKRSGWNGLNQPRTAKGASPFDGVVRSAAEDEELNKLFARLFRGRDGKLALEYLRSITKDMILGDGLQTTALIHLEGQRFTVNMMERRAEHGRRGK